MALKISHKGLILVLLTLCLNLAFALALVQMLKQSSDQLIARERAQAISMQAVVVSRLFYDSGVAMGTYSITKNPQSAKRFEDIRAAIPVAVSELSQLIGDDQANQESVKRIKQITNDGLKALADSKVVIEDNRADVAQFRSRHLYKSVRQLADQLQDELSGLTDSINNRTGNKRVEIAGGMSQSSSRKLIIIGGVLTNIIMALVLIIVFARISIRLKLVSDNVAKLERGEDLGPALSGSDEIAQLDAALRK